MLRARIVLLAPDGLGNQAIAARLGSCEDMTRKWRRRHGRVAPDLVVVVAGLVLGGLGALLDAAVGAR